MKISKRHITQLESNEVFVFGANGQGFHGAGAAGLACRGHAENDWRSDDWFKKALASGPTSEDRIGKWAVLGVGRGFQQGAEGMSYAIQTVTEPGKRRSISLETIYAQVAALWLFAKSQSELHFLIPPIGEGYAGYTAEEMKTVFDKVIAEHGDLENIEFVRPSAPKWS